MLELVGRGARTCDGVSRRNFIKIGSLGVGGLSLPNLLRYDAQAAPGTSTARKKAVILVWLAGGPSHIDMYDLKPEAPAEFRGEFKPIKTNVPGVEIGEHLPLQAQIMDKLSIVRSAYHTNAGHGMGSQWMQTGWHATIEVNDNLYPSVGSVVSRMAGPNDPGLPAYVNLPRKVSFGNAAYLGESYNPFSPDNDPNNDGFQVRNLRLPGAWTSRGSIGGRACSAKSTRSAATSTRREISKVSTRFIVTGSRWSPTTRRCGRSTSTRKTRKLREKYGRNDLGQSCLLARRLVEAGVTFVAIQAGGWDTHGDNFAQLKNNLLPKYDRAVAALVSDLADRGMTDDVLVTSYGEFGRTPRINGGAGRDHWPGAMSILYSGGGLKMGQAIGTTNSTAEYPTSKPYTPGCVLSTVYHTLGIDHHHVFYDQAQRPLAILAEGEPIEELV